MEDEDNDLGNLLDASTGVAEGARFNTDLFEAYGSHVWPPIPRRFGTTPSPPLEDEPPVWRPLSTLSTANRASTWAAVPTPNGPSSTSISRHPSIRRPARSRMVDFHDWTSRRRSSIRDTIGTQAEASDSNSSLSLGNGGESAQTVRRFFPTIPRRPERLLEPREDRHSSDEGRVPPLGVSLDRDWSPAVSSTQPGPSSPESRPVASASGTDADDRPLPRLRRGGVRPPEMLWTHRYPWSAPYPRAADSTTNTNTTTESPSSTANDHVRPVSPPERENDAGSTSVEPVGYPTPSSVDNEPASL